MEKIIVLQEELHKSMKKGLVNLKKSPKDRITVEYVEARLENLERDWTTFRENSSKIYATYSRDAIRESNYEKEELYDQCEDAYIEYKSQLRLFLNKLQLSRKTTTETNSSGASSSSMVRLPKISIPMFSGKYAEWTTFRDLFVSLIHKNSSLDGVQKLHYLKSHLSGEAEQLIRQTPITDANYLKCWQQLEERYNNKRYLANCILKRLLGQRRLYNESASALRELLDTTMDCLNALSNLEINVTTWDVMIIHIIASKFDSETRKQWELHITDSEGNELPSLVQFKEFIETRFRALECLEPKGHTFRPNSGNRADSHNPKALLGVTSEIKCEFCSEAHKLCFCKKFSSQQYDQRREFVINKRMCFNCLGGNHTVYNCRKTTSCQICKRRHHSLLHPPNEPENRSQDIPPAVKHPDKPVRDQTITSCLATGKGTKSRQVLLATALINIESHKGQVQVIRALLDQGSQACFITEDTVQLLQLKKTPVKGIISGVGQRESLSTKSMVRLMIQSRVDHQFKVQVNAYVLKNITSCLPEKTVDPVEWVDLQELTLADPQFNVPNKINVLLGADIYSSIMKEGLKRSPSGTLIAQSTTLGWIVSGVVQPGKETGNSTTPISVMHAQINTDDSLKRFWEIEEQITEVKPMLTEEERKCEDLFTETTVRSNDGRYVVKLPFRDAEPACKGGDSRNIAIARLKSLEKRFARDEELKEKYTEVINEYLQLDHMREVEGEDTRKEEATYLPHHAVIRTDKATTKVRVVFNASEKNKNGVSLNNTLMVGPKLQADLRHTVMRWRGHPIGLITDIVKMYRQVRVSDDDVIFQRIVWRDDPEKEIKDYELLTLTFGTACAPHLAVRALQQTAHDEGHNYSLAAEKVLNNFYMDDLMAGCSNVEEGIKLYTEMTDLLEKSGFKLQKWNSNSKELLQKIYMTAAEKEEQINRKEEETAEKNKQDNKEKEIEIKIDANNKILGLTWNRRDDKIQYSVTLPPMTAGPITKRTVIADIARLFDPLGWIAPCIIIAKIFIQKLWLTGLGWDDKLSEVLVEEWSTYRKELSALTKIEIPRWMSSRYDDVITELHGFSDASKAAYSAVVYLRVVDAKGEVHTSLVVAKTRVAPIKQISIPRLELCGAVLLSKLLVECAEVLGIHKDNIRAWTDSTIVLAWLNSHPSRWKTFVGNRVAEVLSSLNSWQWFHVSTKMNPADCASRGVLPIALVNDTLWYSGPSFLREKEVQYIKPKDNNVTLEQVIKTNIATVPEESLFTRFSSLQRLQRVLAYCRRFTKKDKTNARYLQKKELDDVLQRCLKITQKEHFETEYNLLETKGTIQGQHSKLKTLCPYLDDKGLIRVSGRIQRAQLEKDTKHPIILPKGAHLTKLIVAEAHLKTLHGGPSLMMNYLRSAYWIIGARNLVKHHVHKCVVCVRQKANINHQLMGSLPSARCVPARPFFNSGVDYAGPINIRTTKGRGHRAFKGYICLFICMATRAIHLEVVSDMTTQAFLAAFKRFVSRRGHCAHMWSDNGTTFVGASKELKEIVTIESSAAEHLENSGTEWHFIPPRAPNFGGLWEAGIKATKFHLKRVIGDATLTYEELSTLLCQVEACLNSRPLSVIDTTEPGEPLPLSPGHFLIGEPILTVPEDTYERSNVNCLTRWQFVQKMLGSFWRRWSSEYLSTLMQRYKWTSRNPEPNVGDVVLVKEDDLPPSRWLLGRIVEKHPGCDNLTRVVTLRTKASIFKRPICKICVLPVNQ